MKTTVLVYSQNAYKEYVLPGFVNDEYTIILQRELFQFRQDLKLKFDKIKENWYLGYHEFASLFLLVFVAQHQ